MKAEGKSLSFLCGMKILEVPFFQRPYVWSKGNWEELLDDLLKGDLQFLGSIIIKWQGTNENGIKKAIIVDGQQRLTAISILIKALYDCMEDEQKDIAEDARNALFYRVDKTKSEYSLSIIHSGFDHEAFEKVIGSVNKDGSISSPIREKKNNKQNNKQNDNPTKLESCYKYFYEELKKKYKENKDEVLSLWKFIFNEDNPVLVLIEINEDEEEQKIFDTINSAGVKLTFADIIKNCIFQRLKQFVKDNNKVIDFYNETWKSTFEENEGIIEYWSRGKKGEKGHAISQNIELFLWSYATIKDIFKPSQKESISKLPTKYKQHLDNKIKTQQECEVFIKEIVRYAQIYKDFILEFNDSDTFIFQNSERRLFKILESQKITSYHPYILYLCEKYENNDEERKTKFNALERFIVKVLITKDENDIKNPGRNCELFIKDAKTGEGDLVEKRCNEISNSKIEEKIKTGVKEHLGKMLLFWIELHRRSKTRYDQEAFDYNFQLEHIMPQKWSNHWSDVPYVDEKGKELAIPSEAAGSSELYEKRESKITSLGNMTLLRGKLNNEIKNHNFKTKIDGMEGKKGIKEYADFTITRKDIIEEVFDKGLSVWNEYTIAERAKKLGKEIVDIWGN